MLNWEAHRTIHTVCNPEINIDILSFLYNLSSLRERFCKNRRIAIIGAKKMESLGGTWRRRFWEKWQRDSTGNSVTKKARKCLKNDLFSNNNNKNRRQKITDTF